MSVQRPGTPVEAALYTDIPKDPSIWSPWAEWLPGRSVPVSSAWGLQSGCLGLIYEDAIKGKLISVKNLVFIQVAQILSF